MDDIEVTPSSTGRPAEIMRSGHNACPGCAQALAMRLILRTLGGRTIVVVVPACAAIIAGQFPRTSLNVPVFLAAFETAGASAAGISNALKYKGQDDIIVLALAGDGGTFDIGLQSLSGAADRNEDFIYVCMDNEAYMNTGIQVSSATPRYTWTGTTPTGNPRRKKQMMEIMAAHRIPYAATASIGFPEDLMRKVKRAKEMRGTRFIHLLSPCPTGWKMAEDLTAKIGTLAVETNIFPLYEIEDGLFYRINHYSRGLPVDDYLSLQGRYDHLTQKEIHDIQAETDRTWKDLQAKADRGKY